MLERKRELVVGGDDILPSDRYHSTYQSSWAYAMKPRPMMRHYRERRSLALAPRLPHKLRIKRSQITKGMAFHMLGHASAISGPSGLVKQWRCLSGHWSMQRKGIVPITDLIECNTVVAPLYKT